LAAAALGCNARATPAVAEERSREFIRLDPSSPRLNYVKVEVAEETDVAPSIQLTGRVTLDEDRTQRVASPLDATGTKILAELGENVKAGQSLVELVSAQAAGMQAEAQKAEQDLSVAEKALERSKALRLEGAISDKDAAQIEADFKKAKAEAARGSAQ